MIKKIYSEWYDPRDGHVYSIAETRFLGILIHQYFIYNMKIIKIN